MAGAEIPAHVYQSNWSKLSKDDVIDKIKGTLYGQAIGDAIGLATEFMSKAEVKKYYTKKGPSGYNDIVPDFHRSRWVKGDWTDDTDQMLLILLGVVENKGKVLKEDFAKRMRNWREEGFAELGDRGGLGIGMTTHHTICHKRFLEDPHKAAHDIWESSGFFLAANGAAMRTSVLGIVNFNDLDKVWENTQEISLTTHADPRCTASCIAITTAIALMLQGEYDACKSKPLTELVNRCLQKALEYVTEAQHKKELTDHVMVKSWDKLALDDRKTMGYTYKTLGAGFYALRSSKEFKKTIMELIMQGGDADTNGAVAGALMGCKFGFKNLPEDLLNFPHRKWLDRKIQQFLRTIGLIDEQPEAVPHKEQKDEDVTMEHSGDDPSTKVVASDSTEVVPNSTPPTGDDVTTVEQEAVPHREQKDEDVTMEHSGDDPSTKVVASDSTAVVPNSTPPTGDDVTTVEQEDVHNKEQKDDKSMEHSSVDDPTVSDNTANSDPVITASTDNDVTAPSTGNVTAPPTVDDVITAEDVHNKEQDNKLMEHSGDDPSTNVVASDSTEVIPNSTPPTVDDVTTAEDVHNKEQKDDKLMEHSSVSGTTTVTDNTTIPNPTTNPPNDDEPCGKEDTTDRCSDITPSGPSDTIIDNDQIASSDEKQDS